MLSRGRTMVVQSAVRLPTPSPTRSKRQRSESRSPSPRRQPPPKSVQPVEPVEPAPPKKSLLNMRSGGAYIPPARLRAMQAQITDKSGEEYQRMAWEALKKSINGLINKVNVSNIKHIVPELFGENLVRGRGLFCRSIMKAQAASLPFTPIYAAMAAIVNTKLPQVGELLVSRLIIQFKKAFKRNDKAVCLSSTTFIAQLTNQQVVHETLVAQILLLLLHKPTDDSVEVAVGLTREVGQHLEEMSGPIALVVYDQFRNILHEHDLDKRVQYMIEVLFQIRKDKYKDNPAIKEELDLVEEQDQITHRIELDSEVEVQDGLNIFKRDSKWEENEEAYKKLKADILGEESGSEGDYESGDESSDDEEAQEEKAMEIKDQSNADLVALRKTIFLTLMSSIDFEEACHKLMKINLPVGLESELPSMIIECCAQDKVYKKFYGLIGERFAKLNRLWTQLFEEQFAMYYDTIHRKGNDQIRIIANFFGHMLSSEATGWHVLSVVHLNEQETTSASRIFIKILFQELVSSMGMAKLTARFKDPILQPYLPGIFPIDDPRNTRFSINFFTAIGLGVLTEDMREHLKNLPKPAPPVIAAAPAQSETDSESVSSYSSYTASTCSRSRSPSRGRTISRSRSPPRKSVRPLSYTPSRSPSRNRSYSRSPPRRALRPRSVSVSRSPPRKTRAYSDSRSPPRKALRPRSVSRSPSPPKKTVRPKNLSRSRSPPRKVAQRRSPSNSRPRSPPKRVRRRNTSSVSRSRSRSPPVRRRRGSFNESRSRERSPVGRKRGMGRERSPPARRRPAAVSRSRSPPARKRLISRSRSPIDRRPLSVSRSPNRSRSPPRRRDAKVDGGRYR